MVVLVDLSLSGDYGNIIQRQPSHHDSNTSRILFLEDIAQT